MKYIVIFLVIAFILAAAAFVLYRHRQQQEEEGESVIPSYTLDDRRRSRVSTDTKQAQKEPLTIERPKRTILKAERSRWMTPNINASEAVAWLSAHDTVVICVAAALVSVCLLSSCLRSGRIAETAVSATESFVHNIQESGRITQTAYEAYLDEIGASVNVEIVVTKHDASGVDIIETTGIVLAALENEMDDLATDTLAHVYVLSPGDDIQVKVSRRGFHLYDTLAAAFAGTNNGTVFASKGGAIREGALS